MYDDDDGTNRCITCDIAKKEWVSKSFHKSSSISDHMSSRKHESAMVVAKSRLQYNTDDKFENAHHPVYPFRSACAAASPMTNYVNQVQPLEHRRLAVVVAGLVCCNTAVF
jgi:hypothetical protein